MKGNPAAAAAPAPAAAPAAAATAAAAAVKTTAMLWLQVPHIAIEIHVRTLMLFRNQTNKWKVLPPVVEERY